MTEDDLEDLSPAKTQEKAYGNVIPYVGVACLGAFLFGYHLGYALYIYIVLLVLYYFILGDIGYNNLDIFFGCYSEVHLFMLCCYTSLIQGHKWSSRVPRQGSWDC